MIQYIVRILIKVNDCISPSLQPSPVSNRQKKKIARRVEKWELKSTRRLDTDYWYFKMYYFKNLLFVKYDCLSNILLTQKHKAQCWQLVKNSVLEWKLFCLYLITSNISSGYIPESNLFSNILILDPNLKRLLGF